jgi:ATP-dependent protease ClpP protease subunit
MVKRKRNNEDLEFLHAYGLSIDTREIFLHGSTTEQEDPGVDYRTFNLFVKNLSILEKESTNPIIIHQFNIGGDWGAGMGIYDLILNSKCKFIFLCHGVAASMGSIIPQAVIGKGFRVSYPNCDWLVHDGSMVLDGTFKQVKSTSRYCDYIESVSMDIYIKACKTGTFFSGKTDKSIMRYVRAKIDNQHDWCFNSFEALDYGFIDGVYGYGDFTDVETIKGML